MSNKQINMYKNIRSNDRRSNALISALSKLSQLKKRKFIKSFNAAAAEMYTPSLTVVMEKIDK